MPSGRGRLQRVAVEPSRRIDIGLLLEQLLDDLVVPFG